MALVGLEIHGGENHELYLHSFQKINSPNSQSCKDKQLRDKTYHVSQQLGIMGSLKIWFTKSSVARNKNYAGVHQARENSFLASCKQFYNFRRLCSCSKCYREETSEIVQTRGSERQVRDVGRRWQSVSATSQDPPPPTHLFSTCSSIIERHKNIKHKWALQALTPGS